MPIKVNITFDKHTNIFRSGQVVSGTVEISLAKNIRTGGVSVNILGFSKCQWFDEQNVRLILSCPLTNCFTGTQDYLLATTYLIGPPTDQSIEMQPGNHKYHFSHRIPAEAPSSHEGFYGFTRYFVRVTFYQPWSKDLIFQELFTVTKNLDLNDDVCRSVIEPQQLLIIDDITTCFYSGCVQIQINLMKTGFVPGQQIHIKAEVRNKSKKTVRSVKFCIIKRVYYICDLPYRKAKIFEVCIAQTNNIPIKVKKGNDFAYEEYLELPDTETTYDNRSDIIQISYFLKVVKNWGAVYTPDIPIVIGTIPLK